MISSSKNGMQGITPVTLVLLMLLSSLSGIFTASADATAEIEGDASWPLAGSVDTGWTELSTSTGSDASIVTQSQTNWNLEFAPGAEVSNVTLQVHVNGSDGLVIDSPLLLSDDTSNRFFDFSGYGNMGALNGFAGVNPYADRFNPNSATGAGWTLPSNALVTDLSLEVLAPSDPIALFEPVNISSMYSTQHPDDGQLYIGIDNSVYVLDANNDPEIIDSFTLDEQMGNIVGLEIGPNGNIHIATVSGQFQMISRANGTLQTGLASLETDGLGVFRVLTSGIFAAYNNGSLYEYDLVASEWELKVSNGYTTTLWFDITEVYDIHEQSDVLYLATNNGVPRYDLISDAPLEAWGTGFSSTLNVLHSDTITCIETAGTQLLFGSSDKGIARLDHNSGNWLSTWDTTNLLPSNTVYDVAWNQGMIHILSGDDLLRYDLSTGAFSPSIPLTNINLTETTSLKMLSWDSIGTRSPANDVHVVTNGNGELILVEADLQSAFVDEIIIATGPRDSDINDVVEHDGILYGAGFYSKVVERFDLAASVWLEPIVINDYVFTLELAGDTILAATYTNGIYLIEDGSIQGNIAAGSEYGNVGAKAIYDIDSTGDCSTTQGCEILFVQPYGVYTATADATSVSNPTLIQESFVLNYDVAIYGGVGFIATDEGLLRYDLVNDTFLDTWRSTSSSRLNYAQVAVIGTTMNMGIEGFGVARKNIVTGQSLSTLDSTTTGIANDNIYSVEASGNDLWIGTDSGAWIWDGTTATKVLEGGFYERPREFYDFELDGNTMYAGTSIGLCKYGLSGNFVSVSTCTAFSSALGQVTEVAVNSSTIFAGTNTGVYLIDKATMTVVDTWTTDDESADAEVVVIDDVAYIGLSGIGVARWDITNEEWLTTWGDSVLGANGNIQITGMIGDVANRGLWVAGPQFFRLFNTSTGQVSQSLAINNAHDLTMYGNTLYYHLKDTSDNIFSYDVINSTGNSPLDAGTAFGNQTGSITSLEINGDTLFASVLIVKTTPGSFFTQATTSDEGGLVQYDLANQVWNTTIDSYGSIDVVSYFNSSTGHSWVSWGNTGVEVYAPNGTSIGFWDNISTVTEIVEYDGRILFATENGVQRFNETSFQWEATWTSGNGLPSSTGNIIYELWTDGSVLAVGISDGGLFVPKLYISFLKSDGTWTSYQTGTNNIPRGIPFSMTQCGSYLYASFWNNNGGLSAFDLTTLTEVRSWGGGSFPTGIENNKVSALACDDDEILYVGYNGKGNFNADLPISRYDTQNGGWLSTISQSANGLTSDVISSDGLYHSDGMLFISTGLFGFQATSTTSFSYLQTNSTFTGQVLDDPLRTAVTSYQYTGGELHLARAGGSTGATSILKYSGSGFDTLIQYASLPSGNITTMVGDGSTLWVATQGGVLKGEINTLGDVEWMDGWSIPVGAVTTDVLLIGTDLYLSTTGSGLLKLDTTTGDIVTVPGALHNNQAGLAKVVDSSGAEELIIGLLGSATTASGIQTFDLASQQFTTGSLLAGLPSNSIQGFTFSSDSLFIATSNGIGQWNFTVNAWENTITTEDGLPDSFTSDVFWASNTLYVASLSGMTQYIPTTGASTTLKQSDGLLGNSVASFGRYTTTNQGTWLIAVHDAASGERPGLSVVNLSSNTVISTHRFDQLPSNTVTSVTADYGGVHIATDIGPLTHYNGLTDQFISGISSVDVPSWPIRDMESDGVHLMIRGGSSVSIIEARTSSHTLLKSYVVPKPQNVAVGQNGFWAATRDDGLFGWNKAFEAIESGVARSANPLTVALSNQFFNIGELTHPGTSIELATLESPLSLDTSLGSLDGNGVRFQYVPLAFSSPVSNASIWAQTTELNYDATFEIRNASVLGEMLQEAIDNGQLRNGIRYVPLTLYSATNGSLEVRLTYDWVRKDTPVIITDVSDRPDDGGSALNLEWSLIPDLDFKSYHVYLNQGSWTGLVTDIDLSNRIADVSEALYSRTIATATTANGVALVDGIDYYALVVVEYQDGRFGTPSPIFGPVVSSNEVPTSPAWIQGEPSSNLNEGDLDIEWSKCNAIDAVETRIYASTSLITDTIGLPITSIIPIGDQNSTTLSLTAGIPYWIGATCVDSIGQEDALNATIIGPVIPVSGVNDNTAPAPLENVSASDTPEDNGGRITISWDRTGDADCAFYQIYIVSSVEFATYPTSVGGFATSSIITDCDKTSAIITEYNGLPLLDGVEYYLGVVAFDVFLNGQLNNAEIETAIPEDNLNGEVRSPDRIENVQAFDTPNDAGTSIDVQWTVSQSEDFGFYIVWAADRPIENISSLWDAYQINPEACGCVVFDKQQIDEQNSPITLSMSAANYITLDDSGNEQDVASEIQENIRLYVAVTVHNTAGDAFTSGLTNADVLPVNNLQDTIAPDRIENITLLDRPFDDGSGVHLEFELSSSSDIFEYHVFAAPFRFTTVGLDSNGPEFPSIILDRSPEFPVTITTLTAEIPISPELTVWVAVVPVDFAGNAITTGLITASTNSIDDGYSNDGSQLPEVDGITLDWVNGKDILVTWNQSTSELVIGYQIHIRNLNYSTISEATLISEGVVSTTFVITSDVFQALSNETDWFISVTPFDDVSIKQQVLPVKLDSFVLQDDSTTSDSSFSFDSLLSTQNLILMGAGFAVLVLLATMTRTRGKRTKESRVWENQATTWGFDEFPELNEMSSPILDTQQAYSAPAPPLNVPMQPVPSMVQPNPVGVPPMPLPPVQPVNVPSQQVVQQSNPQQVMPSNQASQIDVSFLDDLL